jgi:hypothetical protein
MEVNRMTQLSRRSMLFASAGLMAQTRPRLAPIPGIHFIFHGMFAFVWPELGSSNPRLQVYAPEVGQFPPPPALPESQGHKYYLGDVCPPHVEVTQKTDYLVDPGLPQGTSYSIPNSPIPEISIPIKGAPTAGYRFMLDMPIPDRFDGYRIMPLSNWGGAVKGAPNSIKVPMLVCVGYSKGTGLTITSKAGGNPIPVPNPLPSTYHFHVYAEPTAMDNADWWIHIQHSLDAMNDLLMLRGADRISLPPSDPKVTPPGPHDDDDISEKEERALTELPCSGVALFSTSPAHCFSVGGKIGS